MADTKVLVVEDDAGLREALVDTLMISGYQVTEVDCGEAALLQLSRGKFDIVVSDVQMPGMSGLQLLRSIRSKLPQLPVLMMTAYATVDAAVAAMREGANDYLAKPFAPEVLLNLVSRYAPTDGNERYSPVVGDPQSEALLKLAAKVAASEANVMVLGPSGSGKEVLARYIHDNSPRADGPFIAINCAAIPENMLEATLFGYEKGAFTGALQACPGKFEQAQNGTILLDEITEMDLGLQAKLLRVLQEREVERLGSRKTVKLNVRVLATSNRELKQTVSDGQFREDLYYRLNVFPLTWKPLSQRPGDIIPLAEHLLARHSQVSGSEIPTLTAAAKHRLQHHAWPGNVRELDNVIQRALILQSAGKVDADDLIIEDEITVQLHTPTAVHSAEPEVAMDDAEGLGGELKVQENQIILQTLESCQGRRKDVAEKLGISPRTLRYKLARMRDLGIELPA
ncbi:MULTISPECIES: sigma-54-dependent transcriptional regulator [Corallincola]|uniref:Sigma-54-dependent Fis family transcriptional regulator n=2 Tax=Corallincola TaxID=1775176 RepID=A0A368N3D6_9GAMM|nr:MULTISPECIES: sigma-54 dependent transcriptional regulator [Corallincola]RCU44573.1 sigma-54-dependent Fis family transcriptional regulator [Corallincola holothuriorum]TAA40318.1 sigma-54-dependent Fis family transcriptional regulator [Corallincola spongiicola]